MRPLEVPQGSFELRRMPELPDDRLQAWDAADEYALRHIAEAELAPPHSVVVVVNDRFGALTVALTSAGSDLRLLGLSDSLLSQRATRSNLDRNGLNGSAANFRDCLPPPAGDPAPAPAALVLFRVPKSLAMLEHQLHLLRPFLTPETRILGSGMTRHVHRSTLELCQRILGPTRTSLAYRKARLIHPEFDPDLEPAPNPHPSQFSCPELGLDLFSHASVFSRDHLDLGTRFLLQQIPATTGPSRVVDLGCGNGALGLAAARANPKAHPIFTDESFMAVDSARRSFREAFGDRPAEFRVEDGLAGIPDASVDLVLNNPPFHADHAVSDLTAERMFADAARALRPGGSLWVVGNAHLGHHKRLDRYFGDHQLMDRKRRFVVLRAQR